MMRENQLTTPCVVIDKNIVKANLEKVQNYIVSKGFSFRPHVKTHKIPAVAKMQIELGATGINCQKISEAKPFVEAGITDVLITYNIVGEAKLSHLHTLSKRCDLKVTADNLICVDGLSKTFSQLGGTLKVMVECDTGGGRCGVQTPQQALDLARHIDHSSGLEFYGLMTYPAPFSEEKADRFLQTARDLIVNKSIAVQVITSGGTPSLYDVQKYSVITEYRAGTYIYCDRSLVKLGMCEFSDCALTVRATVASVPNENRFIIDAGSKALTSDLLNQIGYGYIKQFPTAVITTLSEEHGIVDMSNCKVKPQVGDVVNIIPNHCCVVSNLFDSVYYVSEGEVVDVYKIAARGCVV